MSGRSYAVKGDTTTFLRNAGESESLWKPQDFAVHVGAGYKSNQTFWDILGVWKSLFGQFDRGTSPQVERETGFVLRGIIEGLSQSGSAFAQNPQYLELRQKAHSELVSAYGHPQGLPKVAAERFSAVRQPASVGEIEQLVRSQTPLYDRVDMGVPSSALGSAMSTEVSYLTRLRQVTSGMPISSPDKPVAKPSEKRQIAAKSGKSDGNRQSTQKSAMACALRGKSENERESAREQKKCEITKC